MDLVKQYPCSPYKKLGGYVMLGRTMDKVYAYFEDLQRKVAPNRYDLSSWFDLIEADEGRLQ